MRSRKSRAKAVTEFSLIQDYFSKREHYHAETLLGIGDDAALLQLLPGEQLVVSVDTMVEGVHFLKDVDPKALGHKLLAVNLSDLAAMGAEPRWVTLALTLPENDSIWLQQFAEGLFALASHYQIDLVGGDTTRGPLTLTLQAHGVVPVGKAIRRDGAQAGDLICVTNRLGAAGYALQQLQQGQEAANIRHHLERPMPCVEAGLRLRGYASAMVDVSDGLLADLEHILQRSGVGAKLDLESIPFHPALAELSVEQQLNFALVAGDEYQLCFTLPQEAYPLLCRELEEIAVPITVVGEVEKGNQLKWSGDWSPASRGYQHF